MSDTVPLPDGALDPDKPWAHRDEATVLAWEQRFVQPWLKDWIDCAAYLCWRTGVSQEEAFTHLRLHYAAVTAANVIGLMNAFKDWTEAVRVDHAARTVAYEEQKAATEQWEARQERIVRFIEKQAGGDEPWKGGA